MAKKKKKGGRLFSFCLIVLIAFFSVASFNEIKTTFDLKRSIQESNAKLKELKSKRAKLESKKKKLQDPDYIEYIARGKYLVSKEGEQVFKFPSSKDSED